MSHTGVEVFDFLLFSIYPVIGLLAIEGISRLIKAPKWIKLWVQAAVSIGFAFYYGAGSLVDMNYWFVLSAPQNFPMTALVMFVLAIALIYQGRRAKISPEKSPY